jgi:hypothetical protein
MASIAWRRWGDMMMVPSMASFRSSNTLRTFTFYKMIKLIWRLDVLIIEYRQNDPLHSIDFLAKENGHGQ